MKLWRDPLLLTFAGCVFMFQLSNAAVLPFAIAAIEGEGLKDTDLLVSVALVVSQLVVAIVSPRVGATAQARGRKDSCCLWASGRSHCAAYCWQSTVDRSLW